MKCKVIVALLGMFVLSGLLFFWHSMNDLEQYRENLKNRFVFNRSLIDEIHVVTVENLFEQSISVYQDDGDSGSFLANLDQNSKITVRINVGSSLYATFINSWDRIAFVHINENIYNYSFHRDYSNDLILPFSLNISKRTRLHPKIKLLQAYEVANTAMSAKFRSLSSIPIDLWFDDGSEGVIQAHLQSGQETTTNTYEGHRFFATNRRNKSEIIARMTMTNDQVFYPIYDHNHPAASKFIEDTNKEVSFMNAYYNRTGIHWRHYYDANGPRPPPRLYMWSADYEGQVHSVVSNQGYWRCSGSSSKCQETKPITFELEVLSVAPRAFFIPNFLSDFEASAIIQIAKPLLRGSSVGDSSAGIFTSDTRTSRNGWVRRNTSPITQTLFKRAANLLRIDEALLNRNANVEDLQVLCYAKGQKYDSHHDWGVSGFPESRFLTLLLYLNDQVHDQAGGETAFTKRGIKIHGGKGNAVLFYDLLPDGNGDDLSLHASLPVHEGEKWLANFWVWDPKVH